MQTAFKISTLMCINVNTNQDETIAVWEEVCKVTKRFDRRAIEKAKTPVILALTGLKAKRMAATLQLQTTNATYVYLNPTTVETETLKNMFEGMDLGNQVAIPPIENNISLAELIHMSINDIAAKNFTVNGSVLNISVENGWYYTICTECTLIAHKAGPVWFCPKHGDHNDARFLYRIPVTLSDKTGIMEGTLFDTAATQLLEVTCREMVTKEDPIILLQEMTNKDMKFQIHVQKNPKNSTPKCAINNAIKMVPVQPKEQVPTNILTPKPSTPVKTYQSTGSHENNTKRALFISEGVMEPPTKKTQQRNTND